jgi:hypothetical protein
VQRLPRQRVVRVDRHRVRDTSTTVTTRAPRPSGERA